MVLIFPVFRLTKGLPIKRKLKERYKAADTRDEIPDQTESCKIKTKN